MESSIGGRRFVNFNLDVGIGDVSIKPIENRKSIGWLEDLGFPSITYKLINVEQQFAEKIHAYTLPRSKKNSRVRDLVDMVLLIEQGLSQSSIVARAIEATFKRRKTHSVPTILDAPPNAWEEGYKEMAESIKLSKTTMGSAFFVLEEFWKKLTPKLKDHGPNIRS